jgi:hypothetical protein
MTASFRRLNGAAFVLPLVCGEHSHEKLTPSLVDCKPVCAADNFILRFSFRSGVRDIETNPMLTLNSFQYCKAAKYEYQGKAKDSTASALSW